MNGKPRTLFTWLGESDRPVATIASGLAAIATSYAISGSELASANSIGFSAMERTIYLLADGKAKPQKVKLGISDGIYTEVLEGLQVTVA